MTLVKGLAFKGVRSLFLVGGVVAGHPGLCSDLVWGVES